MLFGIAVIGALLGLVAVGALVWILTRRPTPGSELRVRPRTEQLIAQRGRVTEAIDSVAGSGRVVVGGADWAARAEHPLAVGAEVVVDGADGITLHVTPWRPPGPAGR